MSNIIIIGGGASGLVAAIYAARNKNKVTILEHKDKIGKKILATGNGKCNYTNLNQKAEHYRGNDNSFAMKVLSGFGAEQTIDLFKELGIYPKEKNGYVYPNSEQASSVVEVLRLELLQLKVRIIADTHVEQIFKLKDQFRIITNKETYLADQVILAAGGCASPNLGSDGSGYQLAKSLGHRIIKPLPALVQLKSNSKYFKTLSGVRTEALVALYVNEKFVTKEQGELLLAAYGVSGIPILQISRFASKALSENKKVHLIIDYLPHMAAEEAYNLILYRINRNPSRTVEENLIGLLNNKLIYIGLIEAGVEPTKISSSINNNQIKDFVKQLKEWRVIITEPNSFDQAQVSAGGVDTADINPVSLESKLMKGLYITGELLDVDGTCGGYNLQWAWSTGALAGMNCGVK
ncbi:aminoacetone oxidase family FAD-binding enzyme [Anaerocolumna sedimenticola]|uniref:Aminoacetone oxidase family FAD-binding enzyme n=1 Tax=Anaerocolumna sedimenticola TaxID=2696063 RepID=A0A6P1TQF7_9FIRM|nr:NAD(P)/FAD-dependent oxidoreductase [Anaerocolumna sedimenticola]QHQ62432.1 aminoacetone oxidase family FAD-binding enzyme [Anaerocolumna sedimenticola]